MGLTLTFNSNFTITATPFTSAFGWTSIKHVTVLRRERTFQIIFMFQDLIADDEDEVDFDGFNVR